MEGATATGLLSLVVINTLVLLAFAFSFAKPPSRDWQSFGVLAAFLVALFTEMYGFRLTIYLLAGDADPFAYRAGQRWYTLFGLRDELQFNPVMVLSYIIIAGGFILIAYAWRVLYEAQRNHRLARSGPYSRVRHP